MKKKQNLKDLAKTIIEDHDCYITEENLLKAFIFFGSKRYPNDMTIDKYKKFISENIEDLKKKYPHNCC